MFLLIHTAKIISFICFNLNCPPPNQQKYAKKTHKQQQKNPKQPQMRLPVMLLTLPSFWLKAKPNCYKYTYKSSV